MAVRTGGVLLSYIANVVLSRLLGVDAFGEYVIALSWALVLTLAAKAGFDNSALRYSTVYFEKGDYAQWRGFVRFAGATVAACSIAIGVLFVVAGSSLVAIGAGTRLWAGLLILPLALLTVLSVVLRTTRRIAAAQFYDQMLRPAVIIAGGAFVALVGIHFSAAKAMWLTAFGAFVAVVALLAQLQGIMHPARPCRPRYSEWRQWAALSVPMLLLGVVQELMNQIDIILLGQVGNARQAALFAASWRLASLVPFALVAFSIIGGPLIVTAHDRGATDELHRISRVAARAGFAFALVSALALLAFGKLLLGIFGPGFVAAYPALVVLLLGGIVNAFTGVVVYFATLTGRERQALAIFAGALVLSVVLNLLLIPRFGALGAAIASASALSSWNIAMLIYVRRTIGIDASALALPPKPL
jgi:O-antigen/teichoic acid export membrane protein